MASLAPQKSAAADRQDGGSAARSQESGAASAPAAVKLTRKDFLSDQEVRWCPGCGDYSILNAATTAFTHLNIPRERFVVVSGIGCSSRFPYYVNTYGFHTLHGRAPAVATGVAATNPDLLVWVMTGDGDGLAIGGNHLMHAMRRNVNLKIILFDNRIYGLTKGQYSPTSRLGQVNKTAPFGTVEPPVDPVSLALTCGATFVARSAAIYQKHLVDILGRAAAHKGCAFIQVYQNCPVYNDGAFEPFTEKDVRDDQNVEVAHGKPLLFGKNKEKGIRVAGHKPEIVQLGGSVTEKDVLTYDSTDRSLAHLLAHLQPPEFPMPIGVFREVAQPSYESLIHKQISDVTAKRGPGDLAKLLNSGETWEIKG
ncbi:MAG: 2-oxoacid:ferredoxin oxidoreductase subunit beta [Nitrospirae bacterium]|nr:2-oxoacid:ferredoxin oxidoreductase subunit beta [Nitrospirota bacterium]